MARGRLTAGDVGCWLLKTSVLPDEIAPGWLPGTERTLQRCLRRSYRLDLMGAGQPVVLWVSGRTRPGIHAVGVLLTGPEADSAPDGHATVTVSLRLLTERVPRQAFQASPHLAGAEVLRIAAGSNPSYLTARQVAALRGRCGQG